MVGDDEIIGIADVVSDFEIMLDELIQFIEINVRENLRSEIADWASLTLSLDAVPEQENFQSVLLQAITYQDLLRAQR